MSEQDLSDQILKWIDDLRSDDHDIRESAAVQLLEAGAGAVSPLISALHDPHCRVRYYAAWALGQLGDTRAIEPLIEAIRDENPTVQDWAASALGEIGDPGAVEPLIEALSHPEPNVRRNAAIALGYIKDTRAV